MPVRLVAVSFDVPDPAPVAMFWATLLGRSVVEEVGGSLVPGDDVQVGLRFVAGATTKPGRSQLHLHLTSSSAEDQRRTVETALDLGARHLDLGQRPDEGHVVLADPAGNELCVIEPGNRFLAGCGFLGEVACDGRREVGLFWRDVLGWPLVWDQNEETAVQSPRGGTKISWGGPPVPAKTARNRQRLDLAAPDVAAEEHRVVALGATQLGEHDGGVELADPDGNEFSVRPDQPGRATT
jgi:hypothetical protein